MTMISLLSSSPVFIFPAVPAAALRLFATYKLLRSASSPHNSDPFFESLRRTWALHVLCGTNFMAFGGAAKVHNQRADSLLNKKNLKDSCIKTAFATPSKIEGHFCVEL